MKEKVSIIVPIFNDDKQLKRCILSIVNQDYTNIEIILVDDGSTDNSKSIIEYFSQKDNRIVPIYNKNSGVSSARNSGLDVATGEYITFVDADDYVDKNYISYFLQIIHDQQVSIAMNLTMYTWKNQDTLKEKSFSVSSDKAVEFIYSGKVNVAVWNKMYKRSVIEKQRFNNEIWYGEGMLYNIECLQEINKVAIGINRVYHQTFNPNSAMRHFNLKSNYCGIASLWLQRAKIKNMTREINEQWIYHQYSYNKSIIDGIVRTNQIKANKQALRECIANLRKNILIPMRYEGRLKRKILWLLYFFLPITMAKIEAKRFDQMVIKSLQNKELSRTEKS